MLRCRTFGHSYRFASDGSTMEWSCGRCGALGGRKTYASAADATRYAQAFNVEDRANLGRRAPLIALFPLRIWRAFRDHADGPDRPA